MSIVTSRTTGGGCQASDVAGAAARRILTARQVPPVVQTAPSPIANSDALILSSLLSGKYQLLITPGSVQRGFHGNGKSVLMRFANPPGKLRAEAVPMQRSPDHPLDNIACTIGAIRKIEAI